VKRLAAIVTIAVVVLAMTAGPAFASVCAATDCGVSMTCSLAASPLCPMRTGAPILGAACPQPMDHGVREAVPVQPTPPAALAATPLQAVAGTAALAGSAATPLADARGAPHLTAVIRI
jgi:hypothetical protein